MDKPKTRRLFRFSLRTMFVLVTVLCLPLGWLAWNWQIVQERKAIVNRLNYGMELRVLPVVLHPMPMSFPRNLMGDERIKLIYVLRSVDAQDVNGLRAAYPEAELVLKDDFGTPPEQPFPP